MPQYSWVDDYKTIFYNCISYSATKPVLDYLMQHKQNPEALPDLILLDLNIPEMDGWNFLCVFEDIVPFLTKRIEVFILTSSIDPADGFILKPLSLKLLLTISNVVKTNSRIYNSLRLLGSVITYNLTGLIPSKVENDNRIRNKTS